MRKTPSHRSGFFHYYFMNESFFFKSLFLLFYSKFWKVSELIKTRLQLPPYSTIHKLLKNKHWPKDSRSSKIKQFNTYWYIYFSTNHPISQGLIWKKIVRLPWAEDTFCINSLEKSFECQNKFQEHFICTLLRLEIFLLTWAPH